MQLVANEAFSRTLTEKLLEFGGWNLVDSPRVRLQLSTATGQADFMPGGRHDHHHAFPTQPAESKPTSGRSIGTWHRRPAGAPPPQLQACGSIMTTYG